jgi:RNA polymerase sigma-70 factor, ECF subfamily
MNSQSPALPATGLATLGELYTRFHPQMLRLCLYLLGSMEEAEDAASEVFARLPRALESYDPAQSLEPWLSRVASNYCVDVLRRRRSEQRIFQPVNPEAPEPAADSVSPLRRVLSNEEGEIVRQALARLPEHYRLPLIQRYWQDLGYHEIARNLGLTRANVATLIFRAKKALQGALAMEGTEQRGREWAWSPTR